MELQFKKQELTCLRPMIQETKRTELTQEVRLSDGMPDAGRILGAWGQPVIRSKQWGSGQITVSGGVMTWVLYAPEDGSECRSVEMWVPFQMGWDIPAGEPDGTIFINPALRFVDARAVSSRKFMVRAGVSIHMEAMCPMHYPLYEPEEIPEDVHILRKTYPVCLIKTNSEKIFTMDEEFSVPEHQLPVKLLRYTVRPEILERKIMADKVIFRGNLNLHLLYRDKDGEIQSLREDLPFSQFDQMDAVSEEGNVDIVVLTTGLELDVQDQRVHMKCSLAAQYLLVEDRLVELVQDSYGINREVKLCEETVTLPAILEQRTDTVTAEQMLSGKTGQVLDVTFQADLPGYHTGGTEGKQMLSGVFSLLYRCEDGSLQNALVNWESQRSFPVGEGCVVNSSVVNQGTIRTVESVDGISLSVPIQIYTQTGTRQDFPMITGMEPGQEKEPNPDRPSLILCRPGKENLWSLAKRCGSTVGAIERANHLVDEVPGDRILLIPVS